MNIDGAPAVAGDPAVMRQLHLQQAALAALQRAAPKKYRKPNSRTTPSVCVGASLLRFMQNNKFCD
jgi:hypothetical protein